MNIRLAAWHLKDFNVGLGRYARSLIEAIGAVDRSHQYEIFMPASAIIFPARPNVRYHKLTIPVFKRRVWEQAVSLCPGGYDVLHFPYDSCVLWKRGRFLVTIHDVKPLLFNLGRPSPPWLERLLVRDRRAMIDHVITDSESSRQDIVKHLGYDEDRVTVVYPGVDLLRFRPKTDRPAAAARPYVLSVAGNDPTKNVETLIDAFARLPAALRDSHHLVLAGDFRRRPDLKERVAQAGLEGRTVFTGVVSDERLIDLYQDAALFVFPSRYEGFGLPVLEAMACGCPVISSNASSLPEVAGAAAILIDPVDVEGLAQQMGRVLEDQGLQRALRERGLAQAAQFSWERTARETIAVYEKVAGLTGC
ncbi:glycosyltransferase family 4 protein [Candidatus Nitrospira bockiana]